jgi:hypothetical protein
MHRTYRMIAIAFLAAALGAGCGTDPGVTAAEGMTSSTSASLSDTPTVASAARSPIDGEYRMTLTRREVLAAGFPGSLAGEVAGAWRVTFSFEYAQQFVNVGGANGITSDGYQGGFSVDGNRLTLSQEPPLVFRWRLVGTRLILQLADPGDADPVDALIWTIHPWESAGG